MYSCEVCYEMCGFLLLKFMFGKKVVFVFRKDFFEIKEFLGKVEFFDEMVELKVVEIFIFVKKNLN